MERIERRRSAVLELFALVLFVNNAIICQLDLCAVCDSVNVDRQNCECLFTCTSLLCFF